MPSAWKCPQERNGDSTAALIEAKLVTVKSHVFTNTHTHNYSLQLDEVLQFWPSRLKVDSPSPSTERFAESLEFQRYGEFCFWQAPDKNRQGRTCVSGGRVVLVDVFLQYDGTKHIKVILLGHHYWIFDSATAAEDFQMRSCFPHCNAA